MKCENEVSGQREVADLWQRRIFSLWSRGNGGFTVNLSQIELSGGKREILLTSGKKKGLGDAGERSKERDISVRIEGF